MKIGKIKKIIEVIPLPERIAVPTPAPKRIALPPIPVHEPVRVPEKEPA